MKYERLIIKEGLEGYENFVNISYSTHSFSEKKMKENLRQFLNDIETYFE